MHFSGAILLARTAQAAVFAWPVVALLAVAALSLISTRAHAQAASTASDSTFAADSALAIPVPGEDSVRALPPAPAIDTLVAPIPLTHAPPPNERPPGLRRAIGIFGSDLKYVVTSPARMRFRDAVKIAGIAGATALLFVYDEDIHAGYVRSRGHALYDALSDAAAPLRPLGLMAITTPVFAVGALAGKAADWDGLERLSLDMIETHLVSATLRNSIKYLIGRRKPDEGYGSRSFHFGGRSTPSGHASTAFEMATVLSMHADRWPVTVAAYGLATIVALERVEAGAHWPSDVYLGAVAGTAIARTVVRRADERRASPVLRFGLREGTPALEARVRF